MISKKTTKKKVVNKRTYAGYLNDKIVIGPYSTIDKTINMIVDSAEANGLSIGDYSLGILVNGKLI